MKNLYLWGFLLVCALRPVAGMAQVPVPVKQHLEDKPQLFAQIPEKSACRISDFTPYFRLKVHDPISLRLSDQLTVTGEVIAKVQQNAFVQSMNIRPANYPGALLTLSIISEPGKPVVFSGRMVSPGSGDVILLTRENNRYSLTKQWQKYFITE